MIGEGELMYELYRRISNLQKEMNIHKLQGGMEVQIQDTGRNYSMG